MSPEASLPGKSPQATTDRWSGVTPEKCHRCIWTQESPVSGAQVRLGGHLGGSACFPACHGVAFLSPWEDIGQPVLPSQIGTDGPSSPAPPPLEADSGVLPHPRQGAGHREVLQCAQDHTAPQPQGGDQILRSRSRALTLDPSTVTLEWHHMPMSASRDPGRSPCLSLCSWTSEPIKKCDSVGHCGTGL